IFLLSFFILLWSQPRSTLFPYTTLFRSRDYLVEAFHDETIEGNARFVVNLVDEAIQFQALRIADEQLDEEQFLCLMKDDFKNARSEEHTSELQSRFDIVCRLLLEKKKQN